ncbi:MAG: dinitrogenase iron-molybdenum cofactor biosynthesis protein [Clostridiales bacterium]|nr:dinitrogenase iron-molybdenum cofactor biosynthesis protein [Clostridiales bacterium]
MSYKIAIASTDGKVVNEHFGKADKFYIIEVDDKSTYQLIEVRKVIPLCEDGGHKDFNMKDSINRLLDCKCIVVSRIGETVENEFRRKNINVFEISDLISEAILKVISFMEKKN